MSPLGQKRQRRYFEFELKTNSILIINVTIFILYLLLPLTKASNWTEKKNFLECFTLNKYNFCYYDF